MTLAQGKLLIKLIDRECNQSSYNLVKAFWEASGLDFGISLPVCLAQV